MFKLQNKIIILPPKFEHFFKVTKITLLSLIVTFCSIALGFLLLKGLVPDTNGMDFGPLPFVLVGVIIIFVLCFLIYIKFFIKLWEKNFKVLPTSADIILPTVTVIIFGYVLMSII